VRGGPRRGRVVAGADLADKAGAQRVQLGQHRVYRVHRHLGGAGAAGSGRRAGGVWGRVWS